MDELLNFFKTTAGFIALLFFITFAAGGIGLAYYRTYAPAYEDARYEVQKHSKAFIDGTIREVRAKKLEYDRTPEEDTLGRASIRGYILQQAATVDRSLLPQDVVTILEELEADDVNFGK